MKLITDLGNTLLKLAVFDGKQLVSKAVHANTNLDGLRDFISKYTPFKAAILSSVIHHPVEMENILNQTGGLVILTDKTPLPVKNLYLTPETLGNDRIAAAAGAHALFPGRNVLSIDAGTCITFDFLTDKNEYLGGGISPGIRMRLQAMNTFTGKLPLIEPEDFRQLIGRSTKESLLSGTITGITEELRGVIARYRHEFEEVVVVITGGDAEFLHNNLKIDIFAVPDLVLLGLNEILDENVHES